MGDEIGRLSFDIDDVYSFQLKDDDTGLSYKLGSANSEQTVTAISRTNSTATDAYILANHGFRTGDRFTTNNNPPDSADQFLVATSDFIIKIDEHTFRTATAVTP